MKHLMPEKLHVRFLQGVTPQGPIVPRRYTLTHSDKTGDLYLTIGPDYDKKQISGLYTLLMRDEALGEWSRVEKGYVLRIYVHVSGGFVIGTAAWRNKILHREMPLVLEAISYAERCLLGNHPELVRTLIQVYFKSNIKKYYVIESWGTVNDYSGSFLPPTGK